MVIERELIQWVHAYLAEEIDDTNAEDSETDSGEDDEKKWEDDEEDNELKLKATLFIS